VTTSAAESFIAEFMEKVLQTVVQEFTAAGVELPARRYITFALPAADCAQVTVALQQLYLGTPGHPAVEPSPCSAPTTAVLRVEILRSVPTPTGSALSPPVDALSASAHEQILDAEILLGSVSKMCGAAWGGGGVFADVTMGIEQGAYAGPVMNLTVGVP
jgi:hypothetical protein